MKNLVTSPYSRTQIIISKMLYVSVFVIGLYIAAAILVVLSGMLIGLDTSFADVAHGLKMVIVPGMTTVVLVPLMIFLTLVFRNFVVPVIIAFLGTVVGIPIINLVTSYFYPWMIPSNFFFKLANPDAVVTLPIIFLTGYIALFFVLSIIKFRRMDFDS